MAPNERDAVVLAVGEAVSNAIDHGSNGDRTQIISVELALRESELLACIGDRGRWRPGLEGLLAGGGRGHLVMEAFAEEVNIDLDYGGSFVTLRFGRPAPQQR